MPQFFAPAASALAAVILAVAIPAAPAAAQAPPDAAALRARMEPILRQLDAPAYAARVSWAEHVVLSYRLAAERDPTPLELYFLIALRDDVGMPRSAVLSVVLGDGERSPTWDDLRRFTSRSGIAGFVAGAGVEATAERLLATPRSVLLEELRARRASAAPAPAVAARRRGTEVSGVEYQTFFGYLHAHSRLSDGEGSPTLAYGQARDEGGLDFFALTDHGELLDLWPWEHEWDQLRAAAEAAYEPGVYATLWGFEWSNPILGHINVLNTDGFTNAFFDFDLDDIYDWIVARPQAIGRFNHPGRYDDLHLEFDHLDLVTGAVPQMVGIETWNKDGGLGEFFYDCDWLFCDGTYLDEGNGKGWMLGALGAQDNHDMDWGSRNAFRVAVLAEELTREEVLEAYSLRRFYATEDQDLLLDVRVEGYPMGSVLAGAERLFEVTATDGGGDGFIEARLYRNGILIAVESVSGSSVAVTFDDTGRSGDDYYYVIVLQADDGDGDGRGDEAVSSPIWIDG